jgi:hypothetical protein
MSDIANRGEYYPLNLRSEVAFKKRFHEHGFWSEEEYRFLIGAARRGYRNCNGNCACVTFSSASPVTAHRQHSRRTTRRCSSPCFRQRVDAFPARNRQCMAALLRRV